MYHQLFVSFALIRTDVGVMSKMSGQRRGSARHPSPALPRRVCQSGVDIDESKLDGDSVRPVRRLIITGRNPFDHPLLLPHSLLVSVCPSPSPLCLFCETPEAHERSPLWHMTHTLLSFEFFQLSDPSTTPCHAAPHHPLPTPTYPLTCMRAHTHTLPPASHPSLPDKTGRGGAPAASLSAKTAVVMILGWYCSLSHTGMCQKSHWCFISSYLNIVTP